MIKRLLASLFALAFLASQALASDFLINSYQFGVPPTPTISYVTTTTLDANLTTYAFSTVSTGPAGATRKTAAAFCADDNGATNFSVSSATLDSNSMAEVVDSASTATTVQCAIYIIDNPSGTSGDFSVTFSEAVNSASVSVWAIYDLNSSTATDTATDADATNAAALSLNVDLSANGVGIAACTYHSGATNQFTFTGATERYDTGDSTNAALSIAGGDFTNTSAQTPRTVSCTGPGGGNNNAAGVSASFR